MNQEGVYLTFKTDKEAVAKILPMPLEAIDNALGFLIVLHIKNPTSADDYYETILSVLVKHKDQFGACPISLILGGAVSEMAAYSARDYGCTAED